MIILSPRGTRDILFEDSYKWKYVTDVLIKQAETFGFTRMRTPVFEEEDLFSRSSGSESEVVQKEMYTFEDRSGRKLALRPEGTAGVVRAILQEGIMARCSIPVKFFYILPCYRYEKPQSGRYREFTQFGVEMFGTSHHLADASIILLAESIFKRLSIHNRTFLKLNSVGCKSCRGKYLVALKDFFYSIGCDLCDDCLVRLNNNPLRILDCKNESCKEISSKAPSIIDFFCDDCREQLCNLRSSLDFAGINYTLDPTIVRGLDYYTGVVFEFQYKGSDGKKLTICGGGRYDGLVEQLGGVSTPALGFGIGIDRLLIAMEDAGVVIKKEPVLDFFVASVSDKESNYCFRLVKELLNKGINAQTDVVGRTLSSQLRYAAKEGASFLMVIGDEEIKNSKAKIKDTRDKAFIEVSLGSAFGDQVLNIVKSGG